MALGAETLRDARRRSGLTQTELACRAGVTQSVISAYESGHRQPALSTLAALIDATGFEIDIQLRSLPPGLTALNGPIGIRVRRFRQELVEIAGRSGVTNLRVFGSVARGEDLPDSDVDLLVDVDPSLGLFGLGKLQAELEELIGARVDLTPEHDLKKTVRDRIMKELVPLSYRAKIAESPETSGAVERSAERD